MLVPIPAEFFERTRIWKMREFEYKPLHSREVFSSERNMYGFTRK